MNLFRAEETFMLVIRQVGKIEGKLGRDRRSLVKSRTFEKTDLVASAIIQIHFLDRGIILIHDKHPVVRDGQSTRFIEHWCLGAAIVAGVS